MEIITTIVTTVLTASFLTAAGAVIVKIINARTKSREKITETDVRAEKQRADIEGKQKKNEIDVLRQAIQDLRTDREIITKDYKIYIEATKLRDEKLLSEYYELKDLHTAALIRHATVAEMNKSLT